jgi:hypothetical protein
VAFTHSEVLACLLSPEDAGGTGEILFCYHFTTFCLFRVLLVEKRALDAIAL